MAPPFCCSRSARTVQRDPMRFRFAVLAFAVLASTSAVVSRAAIAQQTAPRAAATPSIEDRIAGLRKIDGYFPLYWDDRAGTLYLEIPRFDSDFLFSTGCQPASDRTTSASIAAAAAAAAWCASIASARRSCSSNRNQSFRSSARTRASASPSKSRSRKSILWGFTVAAESNGRVLVDATPISSCATSTARAVGSGPAPGASMHAQRVLSAEHAEFHEEHRDRHDADVRQRTPPAADVVAAAARRKARLRSVPAAVAPGGNRGGGLFSGSVASVSPSPDAVTLREHASFVELPDDNYKPRIDDPRAGYGGLKFVDYSVPIGEPIVVALSPPPSPGEEGSECGDERAGQADSVLGRPRRAGGREEGAARGRALVEPGVRSCGLPQRVQSRRAARQRRPDGHPLQHDQLGSPLDARLELGRNGHRSAHRRDHQGDGHARLAARSAGLHDLRGPAVAVRQRATRSRRSSTRPRSRASASWPRTKSGTRSALATTTTTARWAGSR